MLEALLSGGARPGASAGLVSLLTRDRVRERAFEVRVHAPLPPGVHTPVPAGEERPAQPDRRDASVVVAEELRVTWSGDDPPPVRVLTLLPHLAATGFAQAPRLHALAVRRARGRAGRELPVAVVEEFLPSAVGGWDWCVEQLLAGDDEGFPEQLGELSGRLHTALATPTPVCPDPVRRAGGAEAAQWHRTAVELLQAVASQRQDGELLTPRRGALLAALSGVAMTDGASVQPVHGSLHVGRLLRWKEGLAVVGFDAASDAALEAARLGGAVTDPADGGGGRAPAARDVAALLCSLEHVARVVERRTAAAPRGRSGWAREARSRCLGAYRAALAAGGRPELLDADLVEPFMIEQELRELLYAHRHVPRKRYAAARTLEDWYGEDGRGGVRWA